ncbi:hypothetical protein, partial [Stenotrophomonas maltophilia]|uniref:hypothetical protein n=1 Tax=Stenotrophomonas maltophilia TaxID=40324 RepID=UPI0019548DC5
VREVPIPPALTRSIAKEFSAEFARLDPEQRVARLWTMSRTTAWRITKRAMQMAGVSGRAATPRGLRHGFG